VTGVDGRRGVWSDRVWWVVGVYFSGGKRWKSESLVGHQLVSSKQVEFHVDFRD
jgi:hypothetical protein